MARRPDPDGITEASIDGTTGNCVMFDRPFDEALAMLTEAATQTWTEGRGREQRTRSRLRLDLMSNVAGGFKAGAEHDGPAHHSRPAEHDLLMRVITELGELDQDAYDTGYARVHDVLSRPFNNGIGNPYRPA